MVSHWVWRVSCYYVADPDRLVTARPDMVKRAGLTRTRAQAGELAIQTVHASDSSKDMEVQVSEAREDIGEVVVERLP